MTPFPSLSWIKPVCWSVVMCPWLLSCGSGPAAPSGPGPSGSAACRTFSSQYTQATSGSAVPLNGASLIHWSCTFDRATRRLSCAGRFGLFTTTSVTFYDSIDDFIAEVTVVPPLTRAASISFTSDADGQNASIAHSYDAQKRLTRRTLTDSTGVVGTENYRTWDSAGRPTRMDGVAADGTTLSLQFSYDDANRTVRQTPVAGNGPVCDAAYSANGDLAHRSCETATGSVTFTMTSTATQTVCR